jgi:hypothetical protein
MGLAHVPAYPTFIAAAFVLYEHAMSTSPLEYVARPLVVAILVAVVVQIVMSLTLSSVHRGSFIAMALLWTIIGRPVLALIMVGAFVAGAVIAHRRQIGLERMPWRTFTGAMNAIAAINLVLVMAISHGAGGLDFAHEEWDAPRGVAAPGAPDIYLIMLDGYPRSDTAMSEFQLDNRPFLATMESMGFDVATRSHSNYNATVLTVASMMTGAHVLPQLADLPDSAPRQYRALSRLINSGAGLRPFRAAGYEVVSVPSAYPDASLLSADRVVDQGYLNYFEIRLLSAGILRPILGEPIWENYRSSIKAEFNALVDLANERTTTPKIVFSHVLVPHMPIAFTRTGASAHPLPCYPLRCQLSAFGDEYGDTLLDPMRQQLEWVNSEVERTTRAIQERSLSPPAIVVFSDHGMRNDASNVDEMFRSFFMAATPGHPRLFPESVSPVTILARLARAYAGTPVPLSSEESYAIDTRRPDGDVLIGLERWPLDKGGRNQDPIDVDTSIRSRWTNQRAVSARP